jgi:UDP-GlcNAc:undecaprenyl-phosphate GlcNAc-1-phosphate transferase
MSWIARRAGAVVRPTDERHMHHATMPLLGGLAMYVGVMVPTLALVKLNDASKAILVGGTIITLVGLVDDLVDIRPLLKFAGQLAAIGVMLYFNVRISRFTLPLTDETFTFHVAVSVALTVLWMGVIINMVNFIDGLDGLAAGVCAISALTFSVIALSLDRAPMGVEAAVLAGAAFAFLRFNFYPASIFMGDTGSMLLGYCLGVISVQGVLKGAATVALIFPLLVLGVPFVDFFRIVFRRWREGVPFYRGGKDHVHHHLVLVVGYSQRKAVLLLYGWCVLLSGLAIAMRERSPWAVVVLGGASLIATLSMLRLLRRFRAHSEEQAQRDALGKATAGSGGDSASLPESPDEPSAGGAVRAPQGPGGGRTGGV